MGSIGRPHRVVNRLSNGRLLLAQAHRQALGASDRTRLERSETLGPPIIPGLVQGSESTMR